MRDLFSGCAYVRTYVAVTLRNVNLRSCLGMSIYADPQESGVTETCITRGRRWRMELGGTFLGDGGRGGQTAGHSQCAYLAESSAETSAERSQSTVEARRPRREQERVQK